MEKKLKFSIIGCQHAHIEIFIREMLALGNECIGICEQENVKLAQAVSDKYGILLVSDSDRLLGEEVDIVGCASINNEKIGIIEKCEQHGKHVMLDKPIVTNQAGYDSLQSVIARGKIEIGMLLTERFNPAIFTLKKHIDQGVLGDIVSIGMRKPHRLNLAIRPQWFFSKEQCGGIIVDLLIHDFDLLRWFTGKEVVAANGIMGKNLLPEYPTFYDTASVQVLMENGIVAQLYADWHTPEKSWTWGDGRIFITGTNGFAELRSDGDPLVSKQPLLLEITHQTSVTSVALEQNPFTITEDFLTRINGGTSLLGHEDLLKASKATIEADEQTKLIGRSGKERDTR